MTKSLRLVGYAGLTLGVFCACLYWTFPYHLVKERLIAVVEQQFGGVLAVSIEKFSPSWFTGAKLKGIKIETRSVDGPKPVWTADRVRVRVGLISLLVGSPKVRFAVKSKGSRINGMFRRVENGFQLDLECDPLDLSELIYLKQTSGANLAGTIEGNLRLVMNTAQVVQSVGEIQLAFKQWKVSAGSKISLGPMGQLEVKEDLVLTKGEGSGLQVTIAKGIADVAGLKLAGGDVEMDLKGQAFLSQRIANVRMNVSGQMKIASKVEQILPFLFLLEKQKQPDGTYPLTMAGNLNRPQIKIGEFPLTFAAH
ncbi:MAG: type II secretion system protein GspN [Deltaproteobacteria bacterium]|nr:type II secretion system protein GspN [Deltaproteobacteria bacterium]